MKGLYRHLCGWMQKQLSENSKLKPGKACAERQCVKLSQELITLETSGPAEPTGADKLRTLTAWQICTRPRAHRSMKVTLRLCNLDYIQESGGSYVSTNSTVLHTFFFFKIYICTQVSDENETLKWLSEHLPWRYWHVSMTLHFE